MTDNKQESKKASVLADNNSMQAKSIPAESPAPAPINIQEKLAPNKNVKIDVDGKSYKIIVDRWESDSLVAHPVRSPKRF